MEPQIDFETSAPPRVCISTYRFNFNTKSSPINTFKSNNDKEMPDGYPGNPANVLIKGPLPPTLTRMWPPPIPQQQQTQWQSYQPPPTNPELQAQWMNSGPPPPMPPPGGPKKRAFICGINYLGTSARLNGCINDAQCMEYLLKSKFNFTPDQILLMRDDHPDPLRRPTKYNMFQGMTWLLGGVSPGDSLIFHYSGHGSQQRDYTGEEIDGMNETLCPMDFQTQGEIVDDDLNRMLVNPVPRGVKLHAIIDACHSGSVLDLPYQATVQNGYATWNASYMGQTRGWKGTGGGFVVQFSAAKDSQTAADTTQLSGGVPTGAATYCFIKAIEERGTANVAYGDLLLSMSQTLRAAGLGGDGSSYGGGMGGGMGSMMPMMMMGGTGGGLDGMLMSLLAGAGGGSAFRGQEPVLSSNYAFDLGYKFSL